VDLRTLQEMLGHSSIVLTADTYTAVLPDVARAAAEKVASLVLEAGRLIPAPDAADGARSAAGIGAGVTARRASHEVIPPGRSATRRHVAAAPVPAEAQPSSVARQGLRSA